MTLDGAIAATIHLLNAGAALHWLKPGKKRPIEENWSSAPRYDEAALRSQHRPGANIGIRLGEPSKIGDQYLHLIDLDIRKDALADEAWDALLEMLPQARSFPTVQSGSGGESRHIYLLADRPFSSKLLVRSPGSEMVWDDDKGREVKKSDWQIEFYGTSKQAVLPPSIHPDTKLPYRWLKPFNTQLLSLGVGPFVADETIEAWGARASDSDASDEDDDLLAAVLATPLDIDDAEVARTLSDLPDDWADDREQWVKVGQALHHQYEGGQNGFERWCEWSRQSDKFDAKDSGKVWKSFKGRTGRPVRFATLIQAAQAVRVTRDTELVPVIESKVSIDLSKLLGIDEPAVSAGQGASPAQKPAAPDGPSWKQKLHFGEKGDIKASAANTALIVANDPRTAGIFCFNHFTRSIRIRFKPTKVRGKHEQGTINLIGSLWHDLNPVDGNPVMKAHLSSLRIMVDAKTGRGGYAFKPTLQDIEGAIDDCSQANAFHPVQEYLESTVWDGVARAETLFIDYLGADDTPYHRAAARLMLLAAVTRVYEPGHKFDYVPILEGVQGKGKSTFISILGHLWAQELVVTDVEKPDKMIEQMQGAWIMEIPELQGFRKAEVNALKGFVTRQVDKARLAWERGVGEYPRQCIFIGSTNDDTYLRDPTGGRRWWPIACNIEDQIDNIRLRREVDQIWAEVLAMYRDMRAAQPDGPLPLFMDEAEAQAEAASLQESRRVESTSDLLASQIEVWLDTPVHEPFAEDDEPAVLRQATCTMQIWREVLGRDGLVPHNEAMVIGQALVATGWARTKGPVLDPEIRDKYGKCKVYRRPSP